MLEMMAMIYYITSILLILDAVFFSKEIYQRYALVILSFVCLVLAKLYEIQAAL